MKKAIRGSVKSLLPLILPVLCLFAFTACQAPQDGPAEPDAPSTADTEEAEIVQAPPGDYVTSFPNRDGSVTVNIDLRDPEYPAGPMPTVRVTPYSFTTEDAKRAAGALFSGAVFYERSRELTREEVEYRISRYEHSLTDEVLRGEYGSDEQSIEIVRQGRQELLDHFRGLYDSAQPRESCHWTFYPISHYLPDDDVKVYFSYHYLPDADSVGRVGDNILLIAALAECPDGRTYSYQVLNTETEEQSEHIIFAFLESYIDNSMLREPTVDDLENIQRKAEALLSEMDLGQFMIDKVRSVYYSGGIDDEGYVVSVSAVPVYGGWPALHQTKLAGASTASGGVHPPKYDPQQIAFHFTADGVLLDFQYKSPLDIVEVEEKETPVIDWEAARDSIEQCLQLDKEPFSVNVDVNVTEMQPGLARVSIEDSATDFRLVPALILRGHRVIYDEDGNVDYTAGMSKTEYYFRYNGRINDEGYESDLLTVSLVDGSVIVQKAFSAQDIDR